MHVGEVEWLVTNTSLLVIIQFTDFNLISGVFNNFGGPVHVGQTMDFSLDGKPAGL